jgi:O-antigen ligase
MGLLLISMGGWSGGIPRAGALVTFAIFSSYLFWRQEGSSDVLLAAGERWLLLGAGSSWLAGVAISGRPKSVFFIFALFGASCLVQAGVAVWQYGDPDAFHPLADMVPALHLTDSKAVSGTMFAKNGLAGVLQIGSLVFLGIGVWGRYPAWIKVSAVWLSVIFAVGVGISGSRAGMMGLGVGVATFIILSAVVCGSAFFKPTKMAITLIVLVGLIPLVSLVPLYSNSFSFNLLLSRLWSDPYREHLWFSVAPSIFRIDPWFGSGAGTFEILSMKYRDATFWGEHIFAHNDWLQLLLDYGVIGLIAGVALFLSCLLPCFSLVSGFSKGCVDTPRFPQSSEIGYLCGACAAAGAAGSHAFFDYNLHSPAVLLPFAGCLGICAGGWSKIPGTLYLKVSQNSVISVASTIIAGAFSLSILWVGGSNWRAESVVLNLENALARGDIRGAMREVDGARGVAKNHPKISEIAGETMLRTGWETEGGEGRLEYFREASRYYEASLRSRPADPRILRMLALCLDLTGKSDEALPLHLRAISSDSRNSDGYKLLANHYFLKRRFEEARRLVDLAQSTPGSDGGGILFENKSTQAPTPLPEGGKNP